MSSVLYADGDYVEEGTKLLTLDDRSFRFGDGVFETLLIVNGKLYDWTRHRERLTRGLAHFGMVMDVSHADAILNELIARNSVREGYGRLIVSRGENPPGAVGYKISGSLPRLFAQVFAAPFPAFRSIRLHLSGVRAFYRAPCKINNAMPYIMALREAEEAGAENALLLSASDIICETATGNLMWIKGNTLFTPSDDLPFVPGTMRAKLLEMWKGGIESGHYSVMALHQADEIFMTNVGGLITSVEEILPLGIRPHSTVKTQALREELVHAIHAA